MKDVAILIVTFLRDDHLFQCVKSIRKYYPELRILIVDQGRWDQKKEDFLQLQRCEVLRLPFDAGLAMSRNLGMQTLKEKYVVICDDDYVFTERTKLENFRTVLEQRADVGLCAGSLESRNQKWNYEHYLDKFKNYYILREILDPKWQEAGGVKYLLCDLVLNFFMLRRSCWKDCSWDPYYKIVQEHVQYFLDLKDQGKWKVAYTPSVHAIHDKKPVSDEYEFMRSDPARKRRSWDFYFKRTGIRFGIMHFPSDGGLHILDLKTGKFINKSSLFLSRVYGDKKTFAESIFFKIDRMLEEEIKKDEARA